MAQPKTELVVSPPAELEQLDLVGTCQNLIRRFGEELEHDPHAEETFHEIEAEVGGALELVGKAMSSDEGAAEVRELVASFFRKEP